MSFIYLVVVSFFCAQPERHVSSWFGFQNETAAAAVKRGLLADRERKNGILVCATRRSTVHEKHSTHLRQTELRSRVIRAVLVDRHRVASNRNINRFVTSTPRSRTGLFSFASYKWFSWTITSGRRQTPARALTKHRNSTSNLCKNPSSRSSGTLDIN